MKFFTKICCALFFALACITQTFAQKHCGNVNAEKKLYQANPDIKLFQQAYDSLENERGQSKSSRDHKYIIPIVFHILHDYGVENISDEQVYDQIRILNEDYNKLNTDTNLVWSEFDTIIANCNFEFRLARLDPQGNPTNGIDRIPSKLTYGAATGSNDNAKLNAWPRYKYLNVWVVKEMIDGVAGYAYNPSSVPYVNAYSKKIDGIIILQEYIGAIGTGKPNYSRALTHEIGHYLNLRHPWGGTNEPGVNCGDDAVDDTPITKGWLTCPPNKNSTKICNTGVVENIQNFMEYSYCSRMFTEGQKKRMIIALNDGVAERNILWQTANLTEAGVADGMPIPNQRPIKADFKTSSIFICEGTVLTLTDVSWNGTVDNRTWNIADGNILDENDTKLMLDFGTAGEKNIAMQVSNSLGAASVEKKVYVSNDNSTYWGFVGESFGVENVIAKNINGWIPVNYANQNSSWRYSKSAGSLAKGCAKVNGYSAINGEISELVSPAFNLGYVASANLNFDYAYATKTTGTDISEKLTIYYSTTCGEKWTLLKNITGVDFANAGMHDDDYIPNTSEWKKITIPLPIALANKNVRFKFQYTASEYSNNLYLDDVNLEGVVGLGEISNSHLFTVSPNPASEKITISFEHNYNESYKVGVYDIMGKQVINVNSKDIVNGKTTINTKELQNGMYIIKAENDGKLFMQKIVIAK